MACTGHTCATVLCAFSVLVFLMSNQPSRHRMPPICRQLGTVINGQRATLAEPAVFFGILHTFADELDAAHKENAEADAVADAASSARKVGRAHAGSLVFRHGFVRFHLPSLRKC